MSKSTKKSFLSFVFISTFLFNNFVWTMEGIARNSSRKRGLSEKTKKLWEPIHHAAANGDLAFVHSLIASGVDPSKTAVDGLKPIHCASASGQVETVKYFAEKYPESKNEKTVRGCFKPIHYAAMCGHLDVARFLIKGLNVNPNEENKRGIKPIHYAAYQGHFDLVRFFVDECNVNPWEKDREGLTPVDYAKQSFQEDVKDGIIQYLNQQKQKRFSALKKRAGGGGKKTLKRKSKAAAKVQGALAVSQKILRSGNAKSARRGPADEEPSRLSDDQLNELIRREVEEEGEVEEKGGEDMAVEGDYSPPLDEDLLPDDIKARIKDDIAATIVYPTVASQRTHETPVKSSLMLQKPKMTKEFSDFVYSLAPLEVRNIIESYEKLGADAFREPFSRFLSRIVVLHGPNGTGKSTLGKMIAKKLDGQEGLEVKLVFVNSGFLGTMYRRSEETNLGEEIAPLLDDGTPCVVVLDETDALVGKSGDNDHVNRNRAAAVGAMIDMIKKKPNFILVWSTNHIDQISSKFQDRADNTKVLKVPLPNMPARERIIARLIKELGVSRSKTLSVNCSEAWAHSLAEKTAGLSIRKLEDVVNVTFMDALLRLPENDGTFRVLTLSEDDFKTGRVKVQEGVSRVASISRWAKIKKMIRENTGSIVTVICTTASAVVSSVIAIILYKKNKRFTQMEGSKNRFVQWVSMGVNIILTIGNWIFGKK